MVAIGSQKLVAITRATKMLFTSWTQIRASTASSVDRRTSKIVRRDRLRKYGVRVSIDCWLTVIIEASAWRT